MSDEPTRRDDLISSTLEQVRRDHGAGRLKPLSEYLERPTGDPEEVARSYLALKDSDVLGMGGEVWDSDKDRIGPYRVIRELGRGGQGVVYLVEDPELDRQAAVKVLTMVGPHAARLLKRFEREARVASRLNHPGICTIYGSGLTGGVPYIAMQYLEGRTLEDLLFRPELPGTDTSTAESPDADASRGEELPADWDSVRSIVRIMEQVARALHAAHEQGIVHRDVKPGNIMMTPGVTPVIMDFGLARPIEDDAGGLTRPGELFGTAPYMSPEQLTASRVRVDGRTDIWSLGVSLYECLTRKLPFEGATREALYQAILTEDPQPARELNPDVDRDLTAILDAALEKNRERRYRTALQLADDLKRYLDHEPLAVRPPRPVMRLVRWVQRRPRLAAAVGGLILSLAAGLGITAYLLSDARGRKEELEVRNAQIARLADVMRLDLLAELEPLLLPASPSHLEGANGMVSWIAMAEELLARRSGHEQYLREVRARSRPRTDAERAVDRDLNARAMPETVAALQRLAAQRRELETSQRPDRAQRIATLDGETATLEALLGARRQWRFADDMDTWRHDILSDVVTRLGALPAKLDRMKERRTLALELERLSIADQREAWDTSCAAVATAAVYGGLHLEPQIGLVPLGADPDSGLQEFAHLPSGAPPPRDPATGRLRITPESSLVFVLLPTTEVTIEDDAPDGTPAPRKAAVEAFFLSKYEMTRGQWRRLRGGDHFGTPVSSFDPVLTHPAALISWWEAAGAMNTMGFSLPDAARGLAASGPSQPSPSLEAATTSPVDTGTATSRGFFGLAGGVWEWNRTTDDPVADPFSMLWAATPTLPAAWIVRCRDGASAPGEDRTRSVPPATRAPDIGLRPARSLDR